MRILSISAQRPDSTGSGVFLTELVRGFAALGCEQAVLAGVGSEDISPFPADVTFFPVRYESAALPFPICGMSDEMPYRSTRYCDMTEEMTAQFRAAFSAARVSRSLSRLSCAAFSCVCSSVLRVSGLFFSFSAR